jgi:hypothetical protein
MLRVLLAIMIALSVSSAMAGTSVYDFLNIPTGARSVGMATAFTAVADHPSGFWWNPAGCARSPTREVSLEYNQYVVGMKRGYLGYLHPLSGHTAVGIGLSHISVGEMTKTSPDGYEEGKFSPLGMAASLAFSTAVTEKPSITAGAAIKWIYQSIDDYSSQAVAVDLGVLYKPELKGVTLGISVQNLGMQIAKFKDEKEPLPLNVTVGGSYSLRDDQLLLSVDLKKPSDGSFIFALGSEWVVTETLAFRLGYSSLGSDWKSDSELDLLGGWSFGVGLRWKRLTLDLSSAPMVKLGNPVWISTSYTL